MGIFYCLTVIAMLAVFVLFKKSEEKINLVNWCVIAILAYLAFNIMICMIKKVIVSHMLFVPVNYIIRKEI